jgi:hypothetical protein
MVIVGRGEEGLQRRSSLDRHSRPSCQQDYIAASEAVTVVIAASSNKTQRTEAAALIRRGDLLGNFREEPLRPLWPSLAASTAYYILAVSTAAADDAAVLSRPLLLPATRTAASCRREELRRLQRRQQQLKQLGIRKPCHQLLRRLQQHQRQQQLRGRQQHQQSAANSNKKKKVAANKYSSSLFDFLDFLAGFAGNKDLAEKAQEGWPGGGGRGAGPAAGGPRLLQPLKAVVFVANNSS